jgi:predicted nucleic acid-binding protein
MVLSETTPRAEWLIDTSALVRLGASTEPERIQRGMVRVATVTLLEVGYSARDATDLDAGIRGPPVSSMPIEYITPIAEDGAVHVLTLLAARGHHRADLVAEITGQPVQRLAD